MPSGQDRAVVAQGARPDAAGRLSADTASAPSLAVADPLLASPSGRAVVREPRSAAGPGPPRCPRGIDPHLSCSRRRACREADTGRSDRAARDRWPVGFPWAGAG